MHEEALSEPASIVLSVITLLIIGSSAILWIKVLLGGSKEPNGAELNTEPLSPLPASNVDFGLFLCALVCFIPFAQLIIFSAYSLFSGSSVEDASIGLKSVLAVLTTQCPMLLTYWLAVRKFPDQFNVLLSPKQLTFGTVFRKTAFYFILTLPLILIAAYVWTEGLKILVELGLIDSLPIQGIVDALLNGEVGLFPIAVIVVSATIIAPIVEELVFRGAIYRFLKSCSPIWAAQLISGILFGAIHLNLYSFGPLVAVGFILAYIYERDRNIYVPICFHMLFNSFNLAMMFLRQTL